MNRIRFAFTLSEVLITLVIIGLVAAISLSTVLANVQQNEMNAKAKKLYSTLANAMTMAKVSGNDYYYEIINNNQQTANNWFDNYIKPNFNIMKICYGTTGCWREGHTKGLNNKNHYRSYDGFLGGDSVYGILTDGTIVVANVILKSTVNSVYKVNSKDEYGTVIYFDVNGAKKPNVVGKDIFTAIWTSQGLVPAYKDATSEQIKKNCSTKETEDTAGSSCLMLHLKN